MVECGCGLYVTSSKERTPSLFCRERGREALGRVSGVSSADFLASDVESSTSASDLSLSCSFSPLESEESVGEESVDAFGTVEPYTYEPVASDLSESVDSHDSDTDDNERLHNTDWLVYVNSV